VNDVAHHDPLLYLVNFTQLIILSDKALTLPWQQPLNPQPHPPTPSGILIIIGQPSC